MRVDIKNLSLLASAVGLVSAQINTNSEGIAKVQSLLEDFSEKLNAEGEEAAKLHEEASCTCKDAFDSLKSAISENQGSHEETEGVRQASQSVFEHLNGAKTLEGSIAHTKNTKATKEASRASLQKEKKDKSAEAMKTISQAEEAIVLIESAEAALQAATDKVNSLQSFIQVQTRVLSMVELPVQEQPKAHVTSHSTILTMLEKLKTDVGKHLEQVRGEWTVEENRLLGLIQVLNDEISTLATKIKDDTATMEDERASVLEADQKMHGLQLEIESDTKTLKTTQERCQEAKNEYEADKKTRLAELQTVSSALRVLIAKFNAAPTPALPANAEGTEGENSPIACILTPTDAPVAIPSAFVQLSSMSHRSRVGSVRRASFLQRRGPVDDDEMLETEYDDALTTLRNANRNKKSLVLTSVISSLRKKDPLKKVRVMIKNLIQRLKDEAINEKNRHEYCTTEETAKQEARTSKKKALKKYETGLEKAQESIAECKEQISELEKSIKELKKTCADQNGQYQYDIHMHKSAVEVAEHGIEALTAVMKEMGAFFSDANQEKVESSYGGDTNAAAGITGMMEALKDDFQKTLDTSTEESQRLETEAANLVTSTSNEIADKREQERQVVEMELSPSIEKYKANGSGLHQTAQEYSLLTEELIVLKYESEACSDTQLSKEEEAANKEAEIQALKDALEILNNHGNN